jgi:hypothetical protein
MAVVSELPIKRLTRATRTGQSALAAEQGPSAVINTWSGTGGEDSHRKKQYTRNTLTAPDRNRD